MLQKNKFKSILIVILFGILSKNEAQTVTTPDGILFQAVATDPQGYPAAGRTIYIKDAIIRSSPNGQVVFSETFKVTASSTGVFTIVIGKGSVVSGPISINNIDWTSGPYFFNIKVAIEPSVAINGWNAANEYVDMGTSQFWSVPFATYAANVKGLDLKLSIADTSNMLKNYVKTNNLITKEDVQNKSTDAQLGNSDILYPTQKAVKAYVDGQMQAPAAPDATGTIKGKVQLAGDLTGTASFPLIADGVITASKLSNGSVIDDKIVNVSGLKVTGNILGLSSNVTGIVSILNGGTNASNINDAKFNLGLNNVDNTTDLNKPISTATQAALDTKASNSSVQASLDLKAPLASPTFTGTVSGISKTMVGLGNVDNTTDLNKPISTATQAALDTKASSSSVQSALDLKAPLASPTFTGTVSGITKTMVGLGSVDNTSDLNKPISTATQTALDAKASSTSVQSALDLKAPLASPTFTGTVSGITKTMVGLGNVDNTSDLNKPISTATQTALDAKEVISNKSTNVNLDASSNDKYPSVKSIKDYVDNQVSSGVSDASDLIKGKVQLAGDLSGTAALPRVASGAIDNSKISNTAGISDTKLATLSTAGKVANSATSATSSNNINSIVLRDNTGNFSAGTITADFIGNLTGNATTVTTNANLTGDVTSVGNVTTLSSNSISTSKINDLAVTDAKIASINSSKLSGIVSASNGGAGNISGVLKANGSGTVSAAIAGTDYENAITFSAPLVRANNSISIQAASTTQNGYLTSSDWNTFNNKLAPFSSQNSNLVYAGPASGSSAAPGFRSLVAADIPSGSSNYIANSTTQQASSNFNISGTGTIALDALISELTIGKGAGAVTSNTVLGKSALNSNTTGFQNVAVGLSALRKNTTGGFNTAVGYDALYNNETGTGNTSIGASTLVSNTSGGDNIAIGGAALYSNTSGGANIAIGINTLTRNNGDHNTAVGYHALYQSISGYRNSAFGSRAMFYSTGSDNNAFGEQSLSSNSGNGNNAFGNGSLYGSTTGDLNTAIGHGSLDHNTTGFRNTGLGYGSLNFNTTGNYNTAVGGDADVASANLSNATAIGYGAIVTASNTIQLGNSNVTQINTTGSISTAGSVTGANTTASSISGFSTKFNNQTGTTYTLNSSDNGKIITFSQTCTLTIPSSLFEGFNCMIVQKGTGQISINAGSGVTINNRSGYSKTAGQYATASIIAIDGVTFITGGDMSN